MSNFMKHSIAAAALAMAFAGGALAAPLIDFTSLGANNTPLPTSVSLGGVTARGFSLQAGLWIATPLWLRVQANDNGLGVCSETNCATGGGDYNELSELVNKEVILLERPSGAAWTELWVSSLDSGGDGGSEDGLLYWGNTADIPTLLASSNVFAFGYPFFGTTAVEGDLLTNAAAAGFDPRAKYVLFINGGNVGGNEDYLVYGAAIRPDLTIETAEPGSLALILLGLGVAAVRRQRATTA